MQIVNNTLDMVEHRAEQRHAFNESAPNAMACSSKIASKA